MKIYNKQNIPWASSGKRKDKSNYRGNIYATAIGAKKKKQEIQKKEQQQINQRRENTSSVYVEANRKYGWESSQQNTDKNNANSLNHEYTKNNSGEKSNDISNINASTSTFMNTAATSGTDKVAYSNPYLAVANTAKKVVDKGRDFITKNLEKESLQSERKQTYKGFDSITSFVVVFAAVLLGVVLVILTAFIPPVAAVSVAVSGAEYFSSEDTTIISVAEWEYAASEDNVGGQKYKNWYGINGDWCAMFVSWCAEQCGYINQGLMPKSASVANMAIWYQREGLWMSQESGYEPQPGDIVFFQEKMSHVGIVVAYDSERKIITTIEGNTGASFTAEYHEGSRVEKKNYPITYIKITGYGIPQYPTSFFGALQN